jgi:hypothetical protein
MLNRTDLTLSALALSNGLNLGTRSLAADAGVNHGDQNLCTRHSLQDIMRDAMVWRDAYLISEARCAIPLIAGSPFPGPKGQSSRVTVQPGRFAVNVPVEPHQGPDSVVARPGRCAQDRNRGPRRATTSTRGVTKRTLHAPWLWSKQAPGHVLKRTEGRAAQHIAAAIVATTGN